MSGAYLVNYIGSMAVLIILIAACLIGTRYLKSRKFGGSQRTSHQINILTNRTLGGGSSIALMEFDGSQYLIGIGKHGVNVILPATKSFQSHVFEGGDDLPSGDQSAVTVL